MQMQSRQGFSLASGTNMNSRAGCSELFSRTLRAAGASSSVPCPDMPLARAACPRHAVVTCCSKPLLRQQCGQPCAGWDGRQTRAWRRRSACGGAGLPVAHALLCADELAGVQEGGAGALLPLRAGGCDADHPATCVALEPHVRGLRAAAVLRDQVPARAGWVEEAGPSAAGCQLLGQPQCSLTALTPDMRWLPTALLSRAAGGTRLPWPLTGSRLRQTPG